LKKLLDSNDSNFISTDYILYFFWIKSTM
jgi:hypothetical protein